MLVLDYSVEKEGFALSIENRLMISESQINDLLDSLVSAGYDIVSTYIREEK